MPVKKKLILMGAAAALVVTTIISGTLAATTYKSTAGDTTASVSTNSLSLALTGTQEVTTMQEVRTIAADIVPGQTITEESAITNDGDYPFFARVTIYKSWDESDVSENNGDEFKLAEIVVDEVSPLLGSDIEVTPGTDWVKYYEQGDEQITLYYKTAVQPGSSTSSFIDTISIASSVGNEYANQRINLDIKVDAVQADAGQDAIAAVWGVFPTIEGDTITQISEY